MMEDKISLVILSGGKSSRMGQPKALLTINGKTFVDNLAEKFQNLDEILFSVGQEKDFPEIDLPHIVDDYPGCGPLAGIHSALKHARNSWVFILACDSPFVLPITLQELKKYAEKGKYVILPIEDDGRIHVLCGLYHKKLLPIIEQEMSKGNYKVRKVLELCQAHYVPVNRFTDYEKVFSNVNTPEDYKEVKR